MERKLEPVAALEAYLATLEPALTLPCHRVRRAARCAVPEAS